MNKLIKHLKNALASLGVLSLVFSGVFYVHAQSVNDCVGLGMTSGLASILCGAKSIAGNLIPDTDDSYDLGSASLEFQDAFFDGTVTMDAISMPISVVAGANTACSTTCTGFCFFGVNTASATADIVNCADATADECLCVE